MLMICGWEKRWWDVCRERAQDLRSGALGVTRPRRARMRPRNGDDACRDDIVVNVDRCGDCVVVNLEGDGNRDGEGRVPSHGLARWSYVATSRCFSSRDAQSERRDLRRYLRVRRCFGAHRCTYS